MLPTTPEDCTATATYHRWAERQALERGDLAEADRHLEARTWAEAEARRLTEIYDNGRDC